MPAAPTASPSAHTAPLYAGFHADSHGMTMLGRTVLDAWLFELLPREQDCSGWDLQRMQGLSHQVQQRWDELGGLPSRLPEPLRTQHAALYDWATTRARGLGWSAELGDDD
jgi:hypothetical protein